MVWDSEYRLPSLLIAWTLLPAVWLGGQEPKPVASAVVNSASWVEAGEKGLPVGVGGIATIYGANLAREPLVPQGYPLPRRLAGTSVTLDGIPVPLLFASPNQVNFQVPSGLVSGIPYPSSQAEALYPVTVHTPWGSSNSLVGKLAVIGPGIYATGGACTDGLVYRAEGDAHSDGLELVTPDRAAGLGERLRLFATGLTYCCGPADGEAAPESQVSGTYLEVEFLRKPGTRETPSNSFELTWGRATGLAGVDEIRFAIPPDAAEGCAMPIRLVQKGITSPPVFIPIRTGGGRCEDPLPQRRARLRWVRRVVPESSAEGRLEVEFTASRGELPERLGYSPLLGLCQCFSPYPSYQGLTCPQQEQFQPSGFSAGALTIAGAALRSMTITPQNPSDRFAYSVPLPAEAIQPGDYTVRTSGGEIGPFQSTVRIGNGIRVTSTLTPATQVLMSSDFRVNWTGGDPETGVLVRFSSSRTGELSAAHCECLAATSAGTAILQRYGNSVTPSGTVIYGRLPIDVHHVTFIVGPGHDAKKTFTAEGLSYGEHTWSYEYRYPVNQ